MLSHSTSYLTISHNVAPFYLTSPHLIPWNIIFTSYHFTLPHVTSSRFISLYLTRPYVCHLISSSSHPTSPNVICLLTSCQALSSQPRCDHLWYSTNMLSRFSKALIPFFIIAHCVMLILIGFWRYSLNSVPLLHKSEVLCVHLD
jgi:hypothetical protein